MQPPSGAALSFDIIGTDGENAEKKRGVNASLPGNPRPVRSRRLSPRAPARATRKYYKGRKGPMLRAHTSLTFTQNILPPTTQLFSVPPPTTTTITHPPFSFPAVEKLPKVPVAAELMAERRKKSASIRELSPNSASVKKMAPANVWEEMEAGGS